MDRGDVLILFFSTVLIGRTTALEDNGTVFQGPADGDIRTEAILKPSTEKPEQQYSRKDKKLREKYAKRYDVLQTMLNMGDFEGASERYNEASTFMYPRIPTLTGKDAGKKAIKDFIEPFKQVTLTLEQVLRVRRRRMFIVLTVRGIPWDSTATTSSYRAVEVLKKAGKDWMVDLFIMNEL